jgi:glycosyltransferase involved in cell wall biosynthesis
VWLEATTLQRAGYVVSVVCPKLNGFNTSYEVLDGVHIYRYSLPFDATGIFGFVCEFAWCFLRTFMKSVRIALTGPGFDVIHACNPPETYWLLGLLWRPFGKRFLFDHHDLSPEMYVAKFGRTRGILHFALLFLERMTFRVADVVITTNESYKRVAVERGGRLPKDVYVVRSGPDLRRFRVYPPDESWKRGKEHLLVYLGEICSQDGVEHLVSALKLLRDDFDRHDFHCVFLGGGPHQPVVQAYARELGVTELCTFTGNVSDIEQLCRILSSAEVGVVPDPKSPYSDKCTMNKVMEYMFFGLPVVGFDLWENRVSASEAAVLAQGNDDRDLARCIAALLDDRERRGRMAVFGGRRVREELAWEYSEPSLLAAYEAAFEG